MGMIEVKKEDIPDWEYGDVKIKTFSFGESLKINSWATVGTDGQPAFKQGVPEDEAGVFMLAAGIHFVRTVDGADFWIKPNSTIEDKSKKLYTIPVRSGAHLSKEIAKANRELSDEEKKA